MKAVTGIRALLMFTAILFLPLHADAFFERLVVSSRAAALGGAFTGVADDPSALLYNPAGMTSVAGFSFLATATRPYGVDGLDETAFACTVPVGGARAGIAWHRLALRGVESENLFSLGFAWDYIRTSQDASLSFGGTIDLASVSFADRYHESGSLVTGSLGVLLRPFPIIGIGYVVRNVIPGEFDLISGGTSTRLERTHVWSLAYHWKRMATIVFDRARSQDGRWSNRVGLEADVHENLVLRSGVDGSNVNGGFRIRRGELFFDIAVSSKGEAGTSYLLSVGYSFEPGGKDDE